MNFDPKVVPFERGADFLHQRALKNLRDNNIIDALELMRSAVEKSPENDDYRLELAQLLCDAGCPTSSNRLLLDMLARNAYSDECLYGLAINQLNMNNPVVARKLLRMCKNTTANNELSEQVDQLTSELDMYEALNRPSSRKTERMNFLSDEACERMRCEDIEGAVKLFERALKMDSRQKDIRALLAMAYMMQGRTDEALKNADIASANAIGDIRALCVSAQVYGMAEKDENARYLLEKAAEADCDLIEKRMLVFALFEASMYELAEKIAHASLAEVPCDKMMIHTLAVLELNMGKSPESAARYWKRIIRIDPEDTIAAYYLKAAEEDRLDIGELTCEYQVPRGEMMRRYLLVADTLNKDLFTVIESWKNNEEFRSLLGWCLISGDRRFRDATVTLLASVDEDEAVSRLREYLMRADSDLVTVIRAAAMYRMRGADIDKILPPHMDPNDGIIPGADRVVQDMGVGHRQIIRFAAEVLEQRYGVATYDAIALMWEQYRKERGTRVDPLLRTETAAAALAYCYLSKTGHDTGLERIAVQFGCSLRQLKFFVRHMMSVLEKGETTDGETD